MSIDLRRGRQWVCWLVLVWFWAQAFVCSAQTNAQPRPAPRLPSVLLIVADGLGYGDLGCYGQQRIQTPRIDQLATNGLRLTDFYAGAADDTLARAALLTGSVSDSGLSAAVPTLAERLKLTGYHTGYIGYWGLGSFESANAPHQRGFEEVAVYGSRSQAYNLYTDHLYRKDPYTGFEGRVPLLQNSEGRKELYVPDLLTQAAVRFCSQNKPERVNHYRPFFLVLSYPVPAAASARSGPVPEAAYADKNWPELQKARANAITRFDQHVGDIVDELDKRDMAEDTIVLVTSSLGPPPQQSVNPDEFKNQGRARSEGGMLSEGRLRVPLIVSWPFWIRSGKISDLLLAGQDLVPTLMGAARLDPSDDLDGISFLPTIQSLQQTNRHSSLRWTFRSAVGTTECAVRRGKWKLIDRGGGQPMELFDLVADPGERHNVADQNPEVVKALQALAGEPDRAPADKGSRPSN